MTIASTDGRDTRPDGDVCESIDGGDALLDRWLSNPPRRHVPSSRPPPSDARDAPEPIGDSVADAWFR